MTEEVEILRDTWGVPHVYADTEFGALYAQGYAMAQDRLPTMMKAYRKAIGRMAEAFGPDWLDHDHQQRIWKHVQVARDRYHEQPSHDRHAMEAFVAGVKRYVIEHPERVSEWALELHPHYLIALARYAIWGWPLGQAWEDLERAEPGLDDGRGSNQWAITARRSVDGCVMTLIDPHVGWSDEWLFYECHLHGGELNAYGFNVTGLPYIGLGHNAHISWAYTTGGPDTADVYELTLNPENPMQYRYDGAWRDLRRETYEIQVRTPSGIETVTRETLFSHHGPLLEVRGNVAYAFKIAYANAASMIEQLAKTNTAVDLGNFMRALSLRMMMPQNAMYGDIYGNIYYQRTGLVPVRPPGYDWTRPVPGDTLKTEWLGFHDTADLVQILNPPAGWMQNCNISPGTMTTNSPLTADRYPTYIYSDSTNRSNPRGRRANELLSDARQMTLEEAMDIANDVYVHGEAPWRAALLAAYEATAEQGDIARPEVDEAVQILRAWDGRAEVDSVGMTLFRAWWLALQPERDQTEDAIRPGARLSEDMQAVLLTSFDRAVRQLRDQFGRIHVPWGEVYRAKRGDRSWPVGGIAGEAGLVTLRAVHSGEPESHGVSYIQSGQSCTTIVMLKRGDVRSYSVVPYGQSEDPQSPHYTDQGRLLFSQAQFKDSWFSRERLEGHIESREVLEVTWPPT